MRIRPYTGFVPRRAKKPVPRPGQGARLLALRKAAGLSQAQLAELIGESQRNISFWERSDRPPRSDILPKLAKALGVSLEELLDESYFPDTPAPLASGPGPKSKLQRTFEEVRRLPRRQQDKIVEFVTAYVDQYKRRVG